MHSTMGSFLCKCGNWISTTDYPSPTAGTLYSEWAETEIEDDFLAEVDGFIRALREGRRKSWIEASLGDAYTSHLTDGDIVFQFVDESSDNYGLWVFECEVCGRLLIETAHGRNDYASFMPEEGGYRGLLKGDYARARDQYKRAIAAMNEKDYARARTCLDEALPIFREIGKNQDIANTLYNLGEVARRQTDYAQARTRYEEALAIGREIDHKRHRVVLAEGLEGIAKLAQTHGRMEQAARLFGAAEALREAISAPISPDAIHRTHQGWRKTGRVDYDHVVALTKAALGEDTFTKAWAQGRAMTLEQAIDYALDTTKDN
ncbi:tetratricopeptide repeat protein [Candidatus Acetothermia bacterium]|nr:tetratricopeptide repeat protein [Candidatus Acetothermia bacterium]MBI3460753.1 tetratricopeptide repeat protein [Candidatus Acetothermia bacterium]